MNLARLRIAYLTTHHGPVLSNMRTNVLLPYPRLQARSRHQLCAVVAAGGPSLRNHVDTVQRMKQDGAHIFAVNEVSRFLVERGVMVDFAVAAAPWEITTDCLYSATKGIHYLISSACPPSTFRKVAGQSVTIWHPEVGCGERELLASQECRPYQLVRGGPTVGLRALALAELMGYSKIMVFGLDGVWAGAAAHAYESADDALGEENRLLRIQMGETSYMTTPELAGQILAFEECYRQLSGAGISIEVAGDGPIARIAAAISDGREPSPLLTNCTADGQAEVEFAAEVF